MTAGGRTVTVFCRMPTGLELRVTEGRDDGTGLKQQRHVGPSIRLKGPRTPGAEVDRNGFAINREVDAALWEAWLEQNRRDPVVVRTEVHAAPEGDAEG